MAITTIDPIVTHMVFMAKLNRLLFFHVPACQVRGTGNLRVNVKRGPGKDHAQYHADPGNVVRASMEKLCHVEKVLKPYGSKMLKFDATRTSFLKPECVRPNF